MSHHDHVDHDHSDQELKLANEVLTLRAELAVLRPQAEAYEVIAGIAHRAIKKLMALGEELQVELDAEHNGEDSLVIMSNTTNLPLKSVTLVRDEEGFDIRMNE